MFFPLLWNLQELKEELPNTEIAKDIKELLNAELKVNAVGELLLEVQNKKIRVYSVTDAVKELTSLAVVEFTMKKHKTHLFS
jgi:uncharacterized protein with ATP-grasp and redox domains